MHFVCLESFRQSPDIIASRYWSPDKADKIDSVQ